MVNYDRGSHTYTLNSIIIKKYRSSLSVTFNFVAMTEHVSCNEFLTSDWTEDFFVADDIVL